jgi:hypothetical protein
MLDWLVLSFAKIFHVCLVQPPATTFKGGGLGPTHDYTYSLGTVRYCKDWIVGWLGGLSNMQTAWLFL